MSGSDQPRHPAVGVLGGTFDPVHIGHLRLAIEVRDALGLEEVRLIPSARPPHREPPLASPRQRLAMLRAAVVGDAGLLVDDREVRRPGRSYTVDTLKSLREELGEDTGLVLILGSDAFRQLHTWHQWETIPELAHLAVIVRPGFDDEDLASQLPPDLKALLWPESGAPRATLVQIPPLQVSATRVRDLLGAGRSVRHLLPEAVLEFVHRNNLYPTPSPVPITFQTD